MCTYKTRLIVWLKPLFPQSYDLPLVGTLTTSLVIKMRDILAVLMALGKGGGRQGRGGVGSGEKGKGTER
jgi:hypothetical protein